MSEVVTVGPRSTPGKAMRQGRSPAFPFISLKKALERAETFRVAEGGRPRHFAPLASAAAAWGMGVKTGPFLQTIAALGHFGLFEFEGGGHNRKGRLTDAALRALLDKQPVSAERDALIRAAALAPRVHADLWQKWGAELPSTATLETYLIRDCGFSESGARDLIQEYKDTIAFAKLTQSDNIPHPSEAGSAHKEGDEAQEIQVGDLIQVEIDGAYALTKPDRVRAIQEHKGRRWVFVETSETGVPMEQAVLVEKGVGDEIKATPAAPKLPIKSATALQPPALPGIRREVFALDEGDVTLTFPDKMSSGSYEDLEAYLKVFLRKAKRQADAAKAAAIEGGDPDEIAAS